jgi:hypothetical protein
MTTTKFAANLKAAATTQVRARGRQSAAHLPSSEFRVALAQHLLILAPSEENGREGYKRGLKRCKNYELPHASCCAHFNVRFSLRLHAKVDRIILAPRPGRDLTSNPILPNPAVSRDRSRRDINEAGYINSPSHGFWVAPQHPPWLPVQAPQPPNPRPAPWARRDNPDGWSIMISMT